MGGVEMRRDGEVEEKSVRSCLELSIISRRVIGRQSDSAARAVRAGASRGLPQPNAAAAAFTRWAVHMLLGGTSGQCLKCVWDWPSTASDLDVLQSVFSAIYSSLTARVLLSTDGEAYCVSPDGVSLCFACLVLPFPAFSCVLPPPPTPASLIGRIIGTATALSNSSPQQQPTTSAPWPILLGGIHVRQPATAVSTRKSQHQRHFVHVSRPGASLVSAQPCSR